MEGVISRKKKDGEHLLMKAKLKAVNGVTYIHMVSVGRDKEGMIYYPGGLEHDGKYFECVNGEGNILEYEEPA